MQSSQSSPKERRVLNLCLSTMSGKMPKLREALVAQDHLAIQKLARDLRDTLGLLRLPILQRLSQEIEYERENLGHETWQLRCDKFCDLTERVYSCIEHELAAA